MYTDVPVCMFTVYTFTIVYNWGQVCSVCGQTLTAPKGDDKQTKKLVKSLQKYKHTSLHSEPKILIGNNVLINI